jgi:hypothetical protein
MDQAPTVTSEKPINSLSKGFNIKSDKEHDFSISISTEISNCLLIKGTYKDNLTFHNYSSMKKIDDIKKNKYFLIFDNIEEIFNELSNLIDSSKPSIIEETNKFLLSIPLPTTKIKEIIFEINEEEKSDKEKIAELYLIISNLKEQILLNKNENNLKKEIIELTSKVEEQNKEIEELKKKKIESWIEYKKEKDKKKEKLLNLDSLIINNNKQYNTTLKNWINPNKQIKAELLYRLSRDGISYETFHKYCDNKGPTLTLIEADEGFITGGYTLLDWDSNSKWKNDKDTFIFSLTENKKFIKQNIYDSIYCLNSYGPWFDNFGFEGNNSRNKFMKECKFQYGNAFLNANEIIPNEEEDKYFDVKEVEVYKIIFV